MTPRSSFGLVAAAIVAIAVVGPMACLPVTTGAPCATSDNCPTGQICVNSLCAIGTGSGGNGGSGGSGGTGGAGGGLTGDGGPGGGSGGNAGGGTGGDGGGTGGNVGGGSGGGAGGGAGGGMVDAGPIDAGVGEAAFGTNACFDGTDNDGDTMTDCADPDCSGALCRATLGDCDTPEVCTNNACPMNTLRAAGFVCRMKAGDCDLEETCNGTDAGCPTDLLAGTGTVCRFKQGDCDIEEKCMGTAACPADVLEPATTICRPGVDCDLPEKCTGTDAGCPPDLLEPTTKVCRPSVGGCDSPESCTGTDGGCPVDVSACPANQFCGGSACVNKQANGTTCTADVQCTTGNCIDGVCCDGRCGDVCDACNLAGKLGTCSAVPNTVVCRAAVDGCDVAESCDGTAALCPANGFANTSTACGTASCTNGSATPQGTCNGSGTCNTPSSTPCAPYVCSGTQCSTTCVTDANCASNAFCSGPAAMRVCKPKQANGLSCAGANECTSGICRDGVCCDGLCGGECESCNQPASPGQCKPYPGNTDPEAECGLYTCDGTNKCRQPGSCGGMTCSPACKAAAYCSAGSCVADKTTGTCMAGCECTTGNCADGFCCDSACVGPCVACNLFGSEGTCRSHTGGTDPENLCGTYNCNGAGACSSGCNPPGSCPTACKAAAYCTAAGCGPDQNNGAACTANCQCASGTCGSFYVDADNDGFGIGAVATQFCGTTPPAGYAANNTDCNDGNNAIRPTATEIAGDNVDQNCDARELCFQDNDNDGFRTSLTVLSLDADCGDTQEALATEPATDCCDTDSNAKPGQTSYFTTARQVCGGFDYNCDTVDTRQRTEISSGGAACSGSGGFSCIALSGIGWIGAVPNCGLPTSPSNNYRDCNITATQCLTQIYSITQACR